MSERSVRVLLDNLFRPTMTMSCFAMTGETASRWSRKASASAQASTEVRLMIRSTSMLWFSLVQRERKHISLSALFVREFMSLVRLTI